MLPIVTTFWISYNFCKTHRFLSVFLNLWNTSSYGSILSLLLTKPFSFSFYTNSKFYRVKEENPNSSLWNAYLNLHQSRVLSCNKICLILQRLVSKTLLFYSIIILKTIPFLILIQIKKIVLLLSFIFII